MDQANQLAQPRQCAAVFPPAFHLWRHPYLTALLGMPLIANPLKWYGMRVTACAGWGMKLSGRIARQAARVGLPCLRLEDGFLRSVGLGPADAPLSIVVDNLGVYYDANRPSRLESLISGPQSGDQAARARSLVGCWRGARVSKYNHLPEYEGVLPGRYVLVADQTVGDASVRYGRASAESFGRMLRAALEENPDASILVKIHPDVFSGRKRGYFDPSALASTPRVQVLGEDVHPVSLIERAEAVYVVTSQIGFEGLLWGKRVRTFGMPFYAGWGLTLDDLPAPERRKPVALENLVHAALVDYARYLDPETGVRCEVERLIEWMGLQRRARFADPGACGRIGLDGRRPVRGLRSFLFLQGCTSPFFGCLADRLASRGHLVSRINFNVGDAVYWGSRPAWNFRAPVERLPGFLEEKFRSGNLTDVIMLGDTRPIHLPVPSIAARFGVRVHVLEEGYFRPNWLTLERDGINGNSRLPKDPDWYRHVGRGLPDLGDGHSVGNPVGLLALHELAYHLPNLANPMLFPGYRTHRPYVSGIEFAGWGRRFARLPFHQRRDRARIEHLIAGPEPFFLLPLQLDSDSQIRLHSPLPTMAGVIEAVMKSFSGHAPTDARLLIKNHPLDTGLVDYAQLIAELEGRFGLNGRVDYVETGHLPTLLAHARGVITVNSTVGTSAMVHRRPTIALGKAIYDVPGLTFQGPLDRFWREGAPPDPDLFRAFRKAVIHMAQVNGGFYTREGIALGVENCARVLEPERSPRDELLRQAR